MVTRKDFLKKLFQSFLSIPIVALENTKAESSVFAGETYTIKPAIKDKKFYIGKETIDESLFLIRFRLYKDTYEVYIPSSEYWKYKRRDHYPDSISDYTNYVTYYNNVIKEIASSLTKKCSSKEESAQRLSDFVQKLVKYNDTLEDYVKFPIETLVERNGDCEDTAILAGTLMKSIGIDVALIELKKHIALGVNGNFGGYPITDKINGKKYFYTETSTSTSHLWRIGEIPEKRKSEKKELYVVR